MAFWRHKSDEPRVVIGDPFAVIPVVPPDVEVRTDSRGMIHLRLRHKIGGMRQKIAGWMGYDYSRKIAMDEYGTYFFKMIDGMTTLRTIADRMDAQWKRGSAATDPGVILFTKKLMTMNMIELKVPRREDGSSS